MHVDTHNLKKISEILLDHIERSSGPQIEFAQEQDYYWHIPPENWHAIEPPAELTLGQLSDDWQQLQHILSGDSPPIGYALVWLASILRAVGESALC